MSAVWLTIYLAVVWTTIFLFFILVQKPLFYFCNLKSGKGGRRWSNFISIIRHGAVSDAIVASYLTAPVAILATTGSILPGAWVRIALTVYMAIVAIALGLLTVADARLYPFWGYKIDASVFPYLRSLKGATASVTAGFIAGWIILWAAISAICFMMTEGVSWPALQRLGEGAGVAGGILCGVVFIIALGLMFMTIRGLGIRPNNPSRVYFSTDPFLNHAALNPGYSIIYSLSTKDIYQTGFREMEERECLSITESIFPKAEGKRERLLTAEEPNILLVIWESANASLMKSLGGEESVASCMDVLGEEGVIFSRCHSSSFRTDRALPAILGGLPGQPTDSVIRHTRKIQSLPAFPRELKKRGYKTTAVHGGDLTIMHKSDYYLTSGHDRLVKESDFPADAPRCKWGVHDHAVLDWLFDDIQELTRRGDKWMTTFQTLSSHEPFIVPYQGRFEDKVKNSFAYTDEALGRFVDRLKKTPAWDNLLMVIVADHGLNQGGKERGKEEYSHIPMLWTGGAVRKGVRIEKIISQTDLAATLLGQLGIPANDFIFSRDVMSESYRKPSAFHSFVNGFTVIDDNGHLTFDNISQTATEDTTSDSAYYVRRGKAILQHLYKYLSQK